MRNKLITECFVFVVLAVMFFGSMSLVTSCGSNLLTRKDVDNTIARIDRLIEKVDGLDERFDRLFDRFDEETE